MSWLILLVAGLFESASLTPANGDIIIASVDGEFIVKTYRTGMKTGKDGRKHRFVALEPANPNNVYKGCGINMAFPASLVHWF